MFSPRHSRAFTLLELMICICLIALLLGVAVPSLTGQTHMRKLQMAFARFDAFVAQAQQRSARDNKPYVLAWSGRGNVRLLPAGDFDENGRRVTAVATFAPVAGEEFILERPSSLNREPASRWTFWPTGNCEPVNVRYKSGVGTWAASFNPLSGRGTIQQMAAL